MRCSSSRERSWYKLPSENSGGEGRATMVFTRHRQRGRWGIEARRGRDEVGAGGKRVGDSEAQHLPGWAKFRAAAVPPHYRRATAAFAVHLAVHYKAGLAMA